MPAELFIYLCIFLKEETNGFIDEWEVQKKVMNPATPTTYDAQTQHYVNVWECRAYHKVLH